MPDNISIVHTLVLIGVIALITLGLRALPFLIFPEGKKTPDIILYLGKVMPPAVIGMLVVYCFKDISFSDWHEFLPAVIAAVTVAALYILRKNTLISIASGTVVYMLLIQLVF